MNKRSIADRLFNEYGLDNIREWLDDTDFYFAPASRYWHGDYVGGLFDHSYKVYELLRDWTSKGVIEHWENERSPFVIGMLHDVCKIGLYERQEDGTYMCNPKQPQGHGTLSVTRIKEHMDLTDEEEKCIMYHMGAYSKDAVYPYSEMVRSCHNVLWVHTADVYASQILEV